jgi:hypothetical protein
MFLNDSFPDLSRNVEFSTAGSFPNSLNSNASQISIPFNFQNPLNFQITNDNFPKFLSMTLSQLSQEMWNLQQQNRLTDTVIIIDGESYPCHKIILASTPGYFEDLFCLNFAETFRDHIEIHVPDSAKVFGTVLYYIYTGDVSIVTLENAVPVSLLATYFRLSELVKVTEQLIPSLNPGLARYVIVKVLESGLSLLPNAIVGFLSKQFHRIAKDDRFASLSIPILFSIFGSKELKVLNEAQLVEFGASIFERLKPSRVKQFARLVKWEMLSLPDWNQIPWSKFINESSKTEILKNRTAIAAGNDRLAPYLLILNSGDYTEAATRYEPALIKTFSFGGLLFDKPERFNATVKQQDTGMIVTAQGNAGFYIRSFCFIVSHWKHVSSLEVVLTAIIPGPDIRLVLSPVHMGERGKFMRDVAEKIVIRRITVMFTVVNRERLHMVSADMAGFSFVY